MVDGKLRTAVVVSADEAPVILAELCHRWMYGGSNFLEAPAENPAVWEKIIADLSGDGPMEAAILAKPHEPSPAQVVTESGLRNVCIQEAAIKLFVSVIETWQVMIELTYIPDGSGSEWLIHILSALPGDVAAADLGLVCAYASRASIGVSAICGEMWSREE